MASPMKRPVTLSPRDREELIRLTTTGVLPVPAIRRARVLLALDTSVGEPDPKDVIAAWFEVSGEMLRLVAQRFADTGGDVPTTIRRNKRDLPPVPSSVIGEIEVRLIALACSTSPAGHARWSLRLLEKHVELTEDFPNLDHSSPGRGPAWMRFSAGTARGGLDASAALFPGVPATGTDEALSPGAGAAVPRGRLDQRPQHE